MCVPTCRIARFADPDREWSVVSKRQDSPSVISGDKMESLNGDILVVRPELPGIIICPNDL